MSSAAQGPPWRGEATNLEAAFEEAWRNAKNGGADPGTYKVEIYVKTTNPIHSYIVILTPGSP
jgi:hypothetical protein